MKLKTTFVISVFVTVTFLLILFSGSVSWTIAQFVDTLSEKERINEFYLPFQEESNENKLYNIVNEGRDFHTSTLIYGIDGSKYNLSSLVCDGPKVCVYIPSKFGKKIDFINYCKNHKKTNLILLIQKTPSDIIEELQFQGNLSDNLKELYFIDDNIFYNDIQKPIFFTLGTNLRAYRLFSAYTKKKYSSTDWYFSAIERRKANEHKVKTTK